MDRGSPGPVAAPPFVRVQYVRCGHVGGVVRALEQWVLCRRRLSQGHTSGARQTLPTDSPTHREEPVSWFLKGRLRHPLRWVFFLPPTAERFLSGWFKVRRPYSGCHTEDRVV